MMDDNKLDKLLEDARESYRVPPAPAVEAIWRRVEAEAFAPRLAPRLAPRWSTGWRSGWKLAAASLVIGVLAGRVSVRPQPAPAATMAQRSDVSVASVARPYQRSTEEVLGGTAVLLAALKSNDSKNVNTTEVSAQATRLLGSVRILLDSPMANDAQMRNLLLDLELTLAQVARMEPTRRQADLTLINSAVAEREIVPRIQSAVVDLAGGGY